MKAMVYQRYGSVDNLELQDVEMPTLEDDQVLVKVCAAALNWLDWHFLAGSPFMARLMAGGLFRPKQQVLGIDMAGRVEAVGKNVRRFQPGDEVFGGCGKGGAFAEYARAGQDELQLIPAGVGFEEAAATGAAAAIALQGLRDAGRIASGQNVLVNGASGGVGTFAVQLAKVFGAHVTGVCSTGNLDLVRSLGADRVVDYTRDDFTREGQRYDLIFDAVAKRTFAECKPVLNSQGTYVTTAFSPALALGGFWSSLAGDGRMAPVLPKPPAEEDRAFIKELLEEGQVRPVIDQRYALADLPEALRFLSQGHARGKVIITI